MDLEDYVGKTFPADIIEDDGIFGGEIKTEEGEGINFILGKLKGDEFSYNTRARPGRFDVRVNEFDPESETLLVSIVHRQSQEILKDIKQLADKVEGNIERLELEAGILREELDICLPRDARDEKRIRRCYRELRERTDILKDRIKKESALEAKRDLYRAELEIVPGDEKYREQVYEMVVRFHNRTSKKPLNSKEVARNLVLDKSLIGLLKQEPVAAIEYIDPQPRDLSDSTRIWAIGLKEIDPEVGKIFLTKALPYIPKQRGHIYLWDWANFKFFKEMGFEKTKHYESGKGRKGDLKKVYRAYRFNPE